MRLGDGLRERRRRADSGAARADSLVAARVGSRILEAEPRIAQSEYDQLGAAGDVIGAARTLT